MLSGCSFAVEVSEMTVFI